MRDCLILTKILLKCSLGGNVTKSAGKSKKYRSPLWLYLLLAICMIPVIMMLFELGKAVYQTLAPMGFSYFVYDFVCLALSVSTLMIALPFVMSVMFLSRDIEYLLPMPLRAWQIAGAKFFTVLLYEYFTTLLMGAPLLAGIGVASRQGVGYALTSALVLLVLPVLPVIYGSLIGVLIIPLTSRLKHKETITTVFSIFIIILAMAFSMFSGYLGESLDGAALMEILLGGRRLIMGALYLFPNLFWALDALENLHLLSLLLYVLSGAAVIALFLLVSSRLYLKAVSGMGEVTQKREKLSASEEAHQLRATGILRSYASREWKMLVRTPVYLLNCVISAFILPLMMIPILAVGLMQGTMEVGNLLKELQLALTFVDTGQISGILLIAVFALSAMLCNLNMTASTCISREGSNYIELKYIPVPYRLQLRGKMLCALSISAVASLPYTVLLTIAAIALLHVPAWLIIPALIINVATIFFIGYLQLFGDLFRPKLEWTSEQAAVKQNFTAMISMLIAFAACLVLGVLCILLYQLRISAYGIAAAGILLLCILAAGIRSFTLRYAEKAFAKM